jgi:hypothetical protein
MLSAKLVLPTDWPGGDDDEVALLEAGRQRVEVGEAGPDAADLAAMGVEVVEPVVGRVEQRLELAKPTSTRFWLTANSSASARSIASWISAGSS